MCEAIGPPEPTYSWSRVGSAQLPLGVVNTGTTLHLFSVSSDDAGTYQCTAGSSRGTIDSQATLTVLGKHWCSMMQVCVRACVCVCVCVHVLHYIMISTTFSSTQYHTGNNHVYLHYCWFSIHSGLCLDRTSQHNPVMVPKYNSLVSC